MFEIRRTAPVIAVVAGLLMLVYWFFDQPDVESFDDRPESRNAEDIEVGDAIHPRLIESSGTSGGSSVTSASSELPIESINSAFSLPNNVSRDVADTQITREFLTATKPNGYARHRIVQVDVAELEIQLKKSLAAWESGSKDTVDVPLFDDVTISVQVTKWQEASLELQTARAILPDDVSPASRASFSISQDGQLDVAIRTSEGNYMIAGPSTKPLFAVFDLTGPRQIDAID